MDISVKRSDLLLLFLGCCALAAAIIFAVVIVDTDPPVAGSVSECRAEVSGRFDAYFALVADAELNGDRYSPEVQEQGPPPLPVARTRLAQATVDRLNINDVCPG